MTLCLLCLRAIDGHDLEGPMPPICLACYEEAQAMPPARRMAIFLKAQQIADDRKKVDALAELLALGVDVAGTLDSAERRQAREEREENSWRGEDYWAEEDDD